MPLIGSDDDDDGDDRDHEDDDEDDNAEREDGEMEERRMYVTNHLPTSRRHRRMLAYDADSQVMFWGLVFLGGFFSVFF